MTFILRLAKVGLRFLYLFLRPLPLKNKVVFFSRQSSTIPLDFTLLAEKIQKQSPETEIVYFCRKMRRKTNVFSYCLFILHSLYHLATASIAVTDTYSIQLCVLRPKRGQTVVQVWHAVGAVKQFSYQCLDKPGGQPAALAKAMEMHKNYDYVFCTSEATADIYAQGFHMPREQILPLGMPRVDAAGALSGRAAGAGREADLSLSAHLPGRGRSGDGAADGGVFRCGRCGAAYQASPHEQDPSAGGSVGGQGLVYL